MKVFMTSAFLTVAFCFFGYAVYQALPKLPPPLEITILRAEKDLAVKPGEILYLGRRVEWSI